MMPKQALRTWPSSSRWTGIFPLDHIEDDKEAEDLQDKIQETWERLQKDFAKKTGLELDLGFHDADEEGDRYDDINGYFFSVGEIWQKTPAARRLEKKYGKNSVDRKFFVTFG